MGDESSGGDRIDGSDMVGRWCRGVKEEPAWGYAESVMESEGRWRARGTSGRLVDGAGLGDGKRIVSREARLSTGEEPRL